MKNDDSTATVTISDDSFEPQETSSSATTKPTSTTPTETSSSEPTEQTGNQYSVGDTISLKFNPKDCDFTYVENGMTGGRFNDGNIYYYRALNIVEGNSVAFTTKNSIPAGKYKVSIDARSEKSGRALFDITMCDQTVTFNSNTTFAKSKTFDLFNSVTVSQTGKVNVNFEAVSSGGLYIVQLNLKVLELFDTTVSPEVSSVMENGASIRLNEQKGIRFITMLDADKISDLKESGATVEYGTLIAPIDLLKGQELTFDLATTKFVNVPYNSADWYNGVKGQIAGSLVSIRDNNITRDFVGRAYVKVTKEGETTITYADYANGDIANNTRSLSFIANAFKGDDDKYNALDDTTKALIDAWAEGNAYTT